MSEIILYQFAADTGAESASPFCAKVHRALSYKGLPYRPKVVGSPAEMKRINPGVGKVPVLGVGDLLIADSTRIIDWLEQHHPDKPLRPADPRDRALDRMLEDQADEGLYWFAVYLRWAVPSNFAPFARRSFGGLPPVVRSLLPRFIRRGVLQQLRGQGLGRQPLPVVLDALSTRLDDLGELLGDRAFLFGEAPMASDLAFFGPIRALAIDTHPESAALIRERPQIVEWLRRVDQATSSEHTVAFEG